jgi:WD40 repeat protein
LEKVALKFHHSFSNLFATLGIAFSLFACNAALPKTSPLPAEEEITEEPTLGLSSTVTSALDLSSTATSTLVPSADILVPQAIALCEAASTKEISGGTISGLALTLVNTSPGSEGWRQFNERYLDLYTFLAQSADQVHALICIDETYKQVATYSDYAAANQIYWQARVVRWPSGEVVNVSPAFKGDRPPQAKVNTGPKSGSPPSGELIRWLAGVFNDQTIIVHEPYYDISNIALSPDGKTLVTVSLRNNHEEYGSDYPRPDTNTIKVWEFASQKLLYAIPLQDNGYVYALAITPDGETLLAFINSTGDTNTYMGQIYSWDLASGQLIKQQDIGYKGQNSYYGREGVPVFSADTSLFAIDQDQSISIYKTSNGALISSGMSADNVTYLAFSPDGTLLAYSDLQEIKVWQTVSGSLQLTLPGEMMVFPPDNKEFALEPLREGWRGIDLVDALTGTVKQELAIEGWPYLKILSMTYSPDGTILVVLSWMDGLGHLTLWNAKENKVVSEVTIPGPAQRSLHPMVFSADGENLAITLSTNDLTTDYVKLFSLKDLLNNKH